MLAEFLLILLVVMFAAFGAVGVYFLIKLSLKLESAVDHMERVMNLLEERLPKLADQSEKTLKAIEESSRAAKTTLDKISRPLDVITSKPAWQAVVGVANSFGMVKRLFKKSRREQEQKEHR